MVSPNLPSHAFILMPHAFILMQAHFQHAAPYIAPMTRRLCCICLTLQLGLAAFIPRLPSPFHLFQVPQETREQNTMARTGVSAPAALACPAAVKECRPCKVYAHRPGCSQCSARRKKAMTSSAPLLWTCALQLSGPCGCPKMSRTVPF